MSRSGSKVAKVAASDRSKAPPTRTVTLAGQLPDRFATVQRARSIEIGGVVPAREAMALLPRQPGAVAAAQSVLTQPKPSKSRARAAHEQAALGLRLAQQGQLAQAIAHLKQSVELDPTVATAQLDLGHACLKAGRIEEGVIALAAAVRLNPKLPDACHLLADALDHLGRTGQALRFYEATVKVAPQRHAAQFRLGQLYIAHGRQTEAEAAFRAAAAATAGTLRSKICEACAADAAGDGATAEVLLRAIIADDPTFAEAHMVLGTILVQAGRSAEAVAHFERGASLAPHMVEAWHAIAENRKFIAADRPLIEHIGSLLERPSLSAAQRMALHFALGKVHDDIGEYAVAMRYFEAANRVRASAARLDRTELARQIDRTIASTPSGYLDRCAERGVADESPILIVGMPRSGTTLVEQILSSHPKVAAGGELSFWADRNRAGVGIFDATTKPEAVRNVAADYLTVLRAISPDAARVTDKTPFNFAMLGVIRQVFPRATIVHCRRHPVDTCLSIFTTSFYATFDFVGDRGNLVFFYRQYERLMAHWREVLPPERFVEVDYEELVADPGPVTRQLVAACGLEWNDACLAPHRNPRRVTTASVWQARQPIYRTSVERWRRYEPWLGELRELLAPAEAGSEASSAQ